MPMGSAAQTVAVQLAVTGAAQVQQATGQAGNSFGRLGKNLDKLQGPATVAGAGVLAFAVSAGKAASDVEQAYGGLDSVFGKNSDTVKKWADGAADNVGLAADDYAAAASKMGAQFKNMGLAQDKTMAGTENMISLGADLSATFGGSTQEAVDALSAAFRGEADSAERYGLNLSAATVQAELAARGQDKLKGQALSAARAQAIMDLATKQAGGSIGQFGREADTAAGQQQRATAQWRNASAALGKSLLPLMTFLATIVGRVSKYMGEHQGVVKVVAGVILGLAVAIKTASAAQSALNFVMKANPIIRIITVVLALGAGLVALYKKSETFRNIVTGVWNAVRSAAVTAWNLIRGVITGVIKVVTAVITGVVAVVKGVWNGLTGFFGGLFRGIATVVGAVWGAISGAITAVVDTVKAVWNGITGFFSGLWDGIKSAASSVWSAISGVIGGVVDGVKSVWNGITGFFGGLWDGIKSAAGTVWDGIKSVITTVADGIKGAWEGVKGFFSGVWDGIKSAASTTWGVITDGASDAWDTVAHIFGKPFTITFKETGPAGKLGSVLNGSGSISTGGVGGSAPSLSAAAGGLNYGGPSGSSRGYSMAPVIIVQALDPAAAGRSVRSVLRADARSRGPIAIGGLA